MLKDEKTEAADREFWMGVRLFVGRSVLGGIGLLGLFTASHAESGATYTAGLALFGFAVAILFFEIDRFFDGRPSLFMGTKGLVASTNDDLLVLLPGRVVMILAGLFLAARAEENAGYAMGLGVAGVSLVMVFLDLKGVFDRLDQ